ncbi:unnamed protein product [Lymnaea stagnalis]|uniref:Uncharacterized protein n=1 Tax=Lymnaea stagnalis TaxID=6523 RepID=A0AAV2H9K0_LYMST
MFVSHAKIRIVGLGGRSRKRRPHRRRLAVKEVVRMPCLLPTTVTVFLGLVAVAAGAGMSVIGYVPSHGHGHNATAAMNSSLPHNGSPSDVTYYALKICSYVGPVVMALGLFSMIVACVFYCEILDKYAILVPDKRSANYDRDELYQVIVDEMKKSYAQTLITAYSKAAERSLLMDNQSSSGDYLPEPIFPCKPNEPLTLEQQIDIECEGYTPSPPVPHKRYSVIQARIQRLRSEDNWLKTSSLPNIRRSASIKRAGRVGGKIKDSRTLSYDYTMDEARLRRKSMMLRSLVQWNSESSDMLVNKQRRFSSVKALPSQRRDSWGVVSHSGYGSFPLTRLIQRRGTFACGDMRTRRMKFLLLLEASESQDAIPDTASMDGRATVTGIRRNSFIPYTTCDKFIADEERKTIKDSRRPSINPFSFNNRFGNTVPQPGTRRHSFFPIRREDKIFVSDINEQRRHSFNPIGVNNTLKPEYAAQQDGRRASFNPDGDKCAERRPSHIPPQSSRFLRVPGCDAELYTERRPTSSLEDQTESFENQEPLCHGQGFQDDRRVERRHSFNPVVRVSVSSSGGESVAPNAKVPKITINVESPSRFLTVPSQEYYFEERERRHSFNTPTTTKNASLTAASSKPIEKSIPQRISFRLGPDSTSGVSFPPNSQAACKSTLKISKANIEPVRPSSFKQEMVVFKPLQRADSRSMSPSSNVSCCGSERLGSDRSMNTSRTTSISSDRSAKTTLTGSPSTVIAAEGVLSYGTFDKTSPQHPYGTAKECDLKSPPTFCGEDEILVAESSNLETRTNQPGLLRKSASFRDARGRGRLRYNVVQTDSPCSISSGPATLTPSAITDANAAIQRSKSSSSLPVGMATLCPQSAHSYARVPKPTSPLVARHKTQSASSPEKKFS